MTSKRENEVGFYRKEIHERAHYMINAMSVFKYKDFYSLFWEIKNEGKKPYMMPRYIKINSIYCVQIKLQKKKFWLVYETTIYST